MSIMNTFHQLLTILNADYEYFSSADNKIFMPIMNTFHQLVTLLNADYEYFSVGVAARNICRARIPRQELTIPSCARAAHVPSSK